MKKTILSVCDILLIMAVGLGFSACSVKNSDYDYTLLDNNTAEIIGYKGSASAITIPSMLDGHKVTVIGDDAFKNCAGLTSITIPDSVADIDDSAFEDCISLTSITVNTDNQNYSSSDGVLFDKNKTELMKYPIEKADASYTIPDSVTSIGKEAFAKCLNVTNVTIPNSVTSIEESAFSGCECLTNITMPDSVTSIGDSAFKDCMAFTDITIPGSVTKLGDYVFADCTSLTNITIPNSIKSLEDHMFFNCVDLTNIKIPTSVTSIAEYALYCEALSDVYYDGTKNDWNKIEIEEDGNGVLAHATIHCSDGTIKPTIHK